MVTLNVGLNDYFDKYSHIYFSFYVSFFIRGKDLATEEAFRKDYGRLAELRSLLHRDVPFVALTATATVDFQKSPSSCLYSVRAGAY